MNCIEVWKDIPGYEGYQASSLGAVRSLDRTTSYIWRGTPKLHTTTGRNLTPQVDRYGYNRVHLHIPESINRHTYRLVALAFLPNPDNHPTVDHINQIKTDDIVENLRWASYALQERNKPKSTRSNTGNHNITCRDYGHYQRYRVITGRGGGSEKGFKTLEEAIAYRNTLTLI